MRLDRHQAGTRSESVLLKAMPRTDERTHTAFAPLCRGRKCTVQPRVLLKMPGVTLPGTSNWRRPGKRANRS